MSYFEDLWDEWVERGFQGELEDCGDFSELALKSEENDENKISRNKQLKLRKEAFEKENGMTRNAFRKLKGCRALNRWDSKYQKNQEEN